MLIALWCMSCTSQLRLELSERVASAVPLPEQYSYKKKNFEFRKSKQHSQENHPLIPFTWLFAISFVSASPVDNNIHIVRTHQKLSIYRFRIQFSMYQRAEMIKI